MASVALCVCLKTARTAGPPGQSGQSAQSPAEQELNKGAGHVMQPVTPVPDLLSRPASAAWANVTAVFVKTVGGVCGHRGRPAR